MNKFAQVQAVFDKLNGGTFVGLDTLTEVKLKGGKANPQQGRITKLHKGARVMCFSNGKSNAYENMVQRRLEQEGKDPNSFTLGPRAWGTRIPNTCFVEHNGEQYLEVIFMQAGETQYLQDGQPINKSDIVGLDDRAPSDEGQGGLNNKVVIRTYKISSIVALRANGEELVF